ncbi:MAG: alanine racemase [Flavobacteriales bacterium]|nr:MAG: alanine racemase [Flavobacteriales bacterium]
MNNLVSNLNYFRGLLNPTTKIMAMVKAFSYGLGTYDVAKLLEENKVDYLGVANIYEGIELRKAGINLPIMVMKPEIDSFDLIVEYHLTPTIFSLHSLKTLIETLDNSNSFSISLKIDSGMHRLGLEQEEISQVITILKEHPFIKIESVYSHLAATDEAIHDNFTNQQIESFKEISVLILNEFGYHIDRHILNSNGIIRFNDAQFDMVRLGIGLYGVSSEDKAQVKLLPASTLKSKISQIKTILKGDTIGYNRKGIATSDIKIATIPVGYADGLSRKLGNGKWEMVVNGSNAPIIGNVCMDMVMIDVTDIDCKEGDEAFVFSDKNPITEMAKCIGTIPYEILTSYSPRVKRVFQY